MKNNTYQFVKMVGNGDKAISVPFNNKVFKFMEKEAISEAKSIKKWLNDNNGSFPKPYITAYAVSHCQVYNGRHYAFFIVNKQFMNKKECYVNYSWSDQIIYNPEILESPKMIEKMIPKREIKKDNDGDVTTKIVKVLGKVSNMYEVNEGCMSFNHKKEKKMWRYYRIKVKYQTRGFFGRIKTHEEWIEGLKAHIFQHEMDHMEGNNIYFNNKSKK